MDHELLQKATPDFPGKWFHCICTTYGAWLWGDERGFRTRHHREHVEGDYKNRPAVDANLAKRVLSTRALKQSPVQIPFEWRRPIGEAILEKLLRRGAFVLCIAVSSKHVHILVKLPAGSDPRKSMGLARKHSTFKAHEQGWQGRLWARRGKELKVKDRRHQLNVYRYILAHKEQGAWVWDWMQERNKQEST